MILILAQAAHAQTPEQQQRDYDELVVEMKFSAEVTKQMYPQLSDPTSALLKRSNAIHDGLEKTGNELVSHPQKALIIARMAARELGSVVAAEMAVTDQALIQVEARHADLYEMTTPFSKNFWASVNFVRLNTLQTVFKPLPDGAAIAQSIISLHPDYRKQWPLTCMAFVEKGGSADLIGLQKQRQRQAMEQKMKHITFPEVTCNGASVEELVDYMRVKSAALDPAHTGVNLIIKPGTPPTTASISLSLKNVPMDEAVRYIAELAGMAIEVGVDAVMIVPLPEQTSK